MSQTHFKTGDPHVGKSHRTAADKRDLHVGGLGYDPSGALAAVVDPLVDASENWVNSARELAIRPMISFATIRGRPSGSVALVGVTLGFLLARRS